MRKKMLVGAVISAIAALTACKTTDANNEQLAQMSGCEKAQALIAAHGNHFDKIKANRHPTKKMTIWDARYHLVGKQCQIWGWGKGKDSYMCSLTAPNKEIAIERLNTARDMTASCLGDDWKASEKPRKLGTGIKVSFSNGGKTSVAVHAVETKGLFNNEWTTYLFVGDAEDSL